MNKERSNPLPFWAIAALLTFLVSGRCLAIFHQSKNDLDLLSDKLSYEVERQEDFLDKISPLVILPPQHLWQESRQDFSEQAIQAIGDALPGTKLILCLECRNMETNLLDMGKVEINAYGFSSLPIDYLQSQPKYQTAKAVALVKETASGVVVRIVSLVDYEVLFFGVVDATKDLYAARGWTNYSQELQRRKEGRALNYIFLNLGVHYDPLAQLEFVEQWGSRNQHMTGLIISVLKPKGAIGGVYHYAYPGWRKFLTSVGVMYPVYEIYENAQRSSDGKEEKEESKNQQLVGQLMLSYVFGTSYGVYVSANSASEFSVGINLLNPILMPILL